VDQLSTDLAIHGLETGSGVRIRPKEPTLYLKREYDDHSLARMKPLHFAVLLVCLLAILTGCNRVHYPINLNTASVEDLMELPDIGPKLADAIIEGRPYKTVDEVVKVKGIGPKTLEKIRDKVTVGTRPAAELAK
jgi:competence ComEA-like helix-hairpin-helix protein